MSRLPKIMYYILYILCVLNIVFIELVCGRHFFCYPVGWICPQHHLLNIAVCCEPARCVSIQTVKQTYSVTKRNVSYVYYRCRIFNDSTETIQPITEISTAKTDSLETVRNKTLVNYDKLGIKNKTFLQKMEAYNINDWLRQIEEKIQQNYLRKHLDNEAKNNTEGTLDTTMKSGNSLVSSNTNVGLIKSKGIHSGAKSNYQQHSKAVLKNNYFSQKYLFLKYNSLRSRIQKRSIDHDELNSEMKGGTVKKKDNIVLKILDNIKNHTNSQHNSESIHTDYTFHNSTTSDENSVKIIEKDRKGVKEHNHKVDVSKEGEVVTNKTEWVYRKRHGSAKKNNTSKFKLNLMLTKEPEMYFKKNSYKHAYVSQYKNDTTKLKYVTYRNKQHRERNINETLNRKGIYMPYNKKFATFSNHKEIKDINNKNVTSETTVSVFLTQNEEIRVTEVPINKYIKKNISEVFTGKKHNFARNKLSDDDFVDRATLNTTTIATLSEHKKPLINEISLDDVNIDVIQSQVTNEYTPVPAVSSTLHYVDMTAKTEIHWQRLDSLLKSTVEYVTPTSNYTLKIPHINIQHKLQRNTVTENILHGGLREKNSSAIINNSLNIESISTQELLREKADATIYSIGDSISELTSKNKTNQKSGTENKITAVKDDISNEVTTLESVNYNTEVVMLENIMENDKVSDNAQYQVTPIDNLKGDEAKVGDITTENLQSKMAVSVSISQTELIAGDDIKLEATTVGNIMFNEETAFKDLLPSEITTFENIIHSEVVAAAENVQNELTVADSKTQKQTINENSLNETATDEAVLQTRELTSIKNSIQPAESFVGSTVQNEVAFENTVPIEVTIPATTSVYTMVTISVSENNDVIFPKNNLQNTEETSSDTVLQTEVTATWNSEKNCITASINWQDKISTDVYKNFKITEDKLHNMTTSVETFIQNDVTTVEYMLSSEPEHFANLDESVVNTNETENDIIDVQESDRTMKSVEYNLSYNDTQIHAQNENIVDGNWNKPEDIPEREVDSVYEQNNTNNAVTVNVVNNNKSIATFPALENNVNDIQDVKMKDCHLKSDNETIKINPNMNGAKDESNISNMKNFNLKDNSTGNAISITASTITNEINSEKTLADQVLNRHEIVTQQEFTASNINEKVRESVYVDKDSVNNKAIMPNTTSVDWVNNDTESAAFIVNSNRKSHSHEHLYENRSNISDELLTYNGIYNAENETVLEILPNPESFHGNISALGESSYTHDGYYQHENSSYVNTSLDGYNDYYHENRSSIVDGHDDSMGTESNNTQKNSFINGDYDNSESGNHSNYIDFYNHHYHNENVSNSIHDVFTKGIHTDDYQSANENNLHENVSEHNGYHNSKNDQDSQYTGYAQNISDNNQESHKNREHSNYNQHDAYSDNYLNENISDISQQTGKDNSPGKILNSTDLYEELPDYEVHSEKKNIDHAVYNYEELNSTQNYIHDSLNVRSEDNFENGSVLHIGEDGNDVQKVANTTLGNLFGTSNININLNSSNETEKTFVDNLEDNNNDINQLGRLLNTGERQSNSTQENSTGGTQSANAHESLPNDDSQTLFNSDSNVNGEPNEHDIYHHRQGDSHNSTLHDSAFDHNEILHHGNDGDLLEPLYRNDSYNSMQQNSTDDIYDEHSLNEYIHDHRNYAHKNVQDHGDYGGYNHDEHHTDQYTNISDYHSHLNNSENNLHDDFYEHSGNYRDDSYNNNSAIRMSYDHDRNVYHDNVDYYERGGNEGLYHNETGHGNNGNYHNDSNYDNILHMSNADYNNEVNTDNVDNIHNEGNTNNMDNADNGEYTDNMHNGDNGRNTDTMNNADNEGNADNMDNIDNEGNTGNMDNADNTENLDRYNTDNDNVYRDTNAFNNAGGLATNINTIIPNIIKDFLKNRGKDDTSSEDDSSSEYEDLQPEKKKVTIKKSIQQTFHRSRVAKRAPINKNKNKNNIATLKTTTTTMKTTTISTAKSSEDSTTTEEAILPEDEMSLAKYLSQNKTTAIPLLTNVVEIHPWTFILETKVETIPLNLTSSEEAALHH